VDFLIRNFLDLQYTGIGIQLGILYFLFLILFTLITIRKESLNHESSQKKVRQYYQDLNKLLAYYEEEKIS
jgi:hypothetical protein